MKMKINNGLSNKFHERMKKNKITKLDMVKFILYPWENTVNMNKEIYKFLSEEGKTNAKS